MSFASDADKTTKSEISDQGNGARQKEYKEIKEDEDDYNEQNSIKTE